jgi:hypothetical protein
MRSTPQANGHGELFGCFRDEVQALWKQQFACCCGKTWRGVTESGAYPATAAPIKVTVSPASVTLTASQTQQFTAEVSGTSNQAVTWSLNPAVGSITASGLYTAPAQISATRTVQVWATSQQDPKKKGNPETPGVAFGEPLERRLRERAGRQQQHPVCVAEQYGDGAA